MQAAVITIGDEILNGTTLDTNSAFLGSSLADLGIQLFEKVTIADDATAIRNYLDKYIGVLKVVIFTGGLGPTADDITKNTIAEYFKVKLIYHPSIADEITERFAKRGLKMTERNQEQAMLPENCTVLTNKMGTAPGMWFEQSETYIISLPGVPYEMKHLFEEQVRPRLLKTLELPLIIHHHIMTSGIGESWLADKIEDIENDLPNHITLAYLPSPGIVKLRLTARGTKNQDLQQEIDAFSHRFTKRIGHYVYGFDGETLQEAIGKRLMKLNATLSLAESCTGGNIGHLITSIPGSSRYFMGSVISYDNTVKHKVLNIQSELLETHGAVSEETVHAMLKGVLELMNTDYAIAVSGVAGPGGGSKEKPVGTVYIGIAGNGVFEVKHFRFTHDRRINIQYSSIYALHELRMLLDKHLEKH